MDGSSNQKKRKWQHDSPRRREGRKGKDMGRKQWRRQRQDKRARTGLQQIESNASEAKDSIKPNAVRPQFSQQEISEEERRPKRKVAVLLGYSGTGYKGMQINNEFRTIEGDLFNALVAAKAISKANANDPKKSGLTRCARTDKGVHAAGNVISLKLIVEDPDVIQNINSHLSSQIRVWGIERTTGSFSCYHACDSRWYEYLIPTFAFLPPHPNSYLGEQLDKLAAEANDQEGYRSRQKEVASFWDEVEANDILPIVESLEGSTRDLILEALYGHSKKYGITESSSHNSSTTAQAQSDSTEPAMPDSKPVVDQAEQVLDNATEDVNTDQYINQNPTQSILQSLKSAYIKARKAHKIDPVRLQRVRDTLNLYQATHNFHNYTIRKNASDPSAKRYIKSFTVAEKPIVIDGQEWLSLKVHGQSFMLHQIRKMVGMAALVVRCGCDPKIITESFSKAVISVPKAPALGLLLERPVFRTYNEQIAVKFGRENIDFGKFEDEIEAFKETEIYERIFREEESGNKFLNFFAQIDNFREPHFLYLTSGGVDAAKVSSSSIRSVDVDNLLASKTAGLESDDDDDDDDGDVVDGEEEEEEVGG